jgi:hypothetical protein
MCTSATFSIGLEEKNFCEMISCSNVSLHGCTSITLDGAMKLGQVDIESYLPVEAGRGWCGS